MNLGAFAAYAVGLGFHIFPVKPGDKVPHPLAGSWGENSTSDAMTVYNFWRQHPTANIGVACKPSNLLVIDLDQAKEDWNLKGTEWEYMHGVYGPRVSGEDLLDEMRFKEDEALPETFSVRTGSGGLHLYYRWDPSWPKISQASPVKGCVDVRGNGGQWGGYVLGAGSVTAAGQYEIESNSPIALPPMWVRLLVMEKPQAPRRVSQGVRQPGAVSQSGLLETVRSAQPGNRNNALVWAARTMCEEGVPEEEAQRVLGDAARQAGLGDMEIERTIESGYRTQRYKEGR
jgi:hypothetical protein